MRALTLVFLEEQRCRVRLWHDICFVQREPSARRNGNVTLNIGQASQHLGVEWREGQLLLEK
eukprot:5467574-Prymnesium_polylepis.1